MKKKTTIDVANSLDITTGQLTKTAKRGNSLASLLSPQYRTLSTTQKAQWNKSNNQVQMPDNPQNNTRPGNGWLAFFANNVALMAASLPIVHTPEAVSVPQNLPLLDAAITVAGPSHDPHFVITLSPDGPAYPDGPVIALWATPAVPSGNTTKSPDKWRAKQYFPVGVIEGGIPAEGVDVTERYLSVFPDIPLNCRIGFQLMAVNPGGYHSEKAYTFAETPALLLAAAGEETDDTDIHLPASGE